MTKREAYREGFMEGQGIVSDGDLTAAELENEDTLTAACFEIAENQKQYADHVTYDFRRDSEWDGYEDGMAAGIAAGVKAYFKKS